MKVSVMIEELTLLVSIGIFVLNLIFYMKKWNGGGKE